MKKEPGKIIVMGAGVDPLKEAAKLAAQDATVVARKLSDAQRPKKPKQPLPKGFKRWVFARNNGDLLVGWLCYDVATRKPPEVATITAKDLRGAVREFLGMAVKNKWPALEVLKATV